MTESPDAAARSAGAAAATRAAELAARGRQLREGTDRPYEPDVAAADIARARERAERALERSAAAHDAAAVLHDRAATQLEKIAAGDDDEDDARRADVHRAAAAVDRERARADRIALDSRRGDDPTG